jgi:DNA-binding CsgD family transcriptional regulator
VLIGVHRGSSTGLDALGSLLGVHPAAVIVFGATRDAELLTAVVARGVCGLMLWDPTGLNPPARAVPAVPLTGLTGPGHAGAEVTERERQILLGMSEGKSNSVIGRDLFLTEDTIKSNTRQLFRKLGARDRPRGAARTAPRPPQLNPRRHARHTDRSSETPEGSCPFRLRAASRRNRGQPRPNPTRSVHGPAPREGRYPVNRPRLDAHRPC